MNRFRIKGVAAALVSFALLLSACGENNAANENENGGNDAAGNNNSNTNETENNTNNQEDGLYITASFSIIADMTEQVLGDRGTVDYIVPIGEEPHEYEPVPSDFRNVSDSDVFYVNGLGLEEWLERIVDNASDTPLLTLSDGVTEIPLEGESAPDPHAWLSPKNASYYIENIVDDLSERDPAGEDIYRENADAYLEEINELDAWIEEKVEAVPEEHRTIVVSENAFKYFGEDYGFETEGIWEINSHEEGTSGQINRLIDVIQDKEIPAVFVETTVDQRYMETVAENAGVEIAGEVYTDAVGQEGSGAETYLEMIRHNAEVFTDGLSGN
ncbi:metal ABC transporter substrate-binding protein [Salipaludibacillus aurantiacus]|uniref:Iron/zinc/copper transport system substrate-binding protein n=1 Tax=Salipaludibacillus aurantiacus TaxID=1601833 RepID=A0A1H9RH99_9BACI|nr:metal ABC transporter substrate-binding protein [Salipaludibacillus aurantiacus]SER72126.1 iron/zinc/copper transport system substrate-binding protein [Salipaludibacillus aurantiacus]